jgi:ubiquinone/menaquinone biosynthesis C-methylase UbiE
METHASTSFDREVARRYEDGRRMTSAEIDVWTDQVASRVSVSNSKSGYLPRVLDLGAGTGRFSSALAERCHALVVGVEPSASMRAIAVARNAHPRVAYVGGRAESIPLRDDSCDAAFVFLSLHHFTDRRLAATEIRRVCKPGSPVTIRTEFADRPHLVYWHGLLEKAASIDRSLYPSFGELCADLAAGGLRVSAVERVPYKAAQTLSDYIDRLRMITISALRIHGEEATEDDLSRFSFSDAELNRPIYEVGHLVICEA